MTHPRTLIRPATQSGGPSPADGNFQVDLWMGLFVFLSIAAVARWVRARGDHERDLLTEAIVLASIREDGGSDTRPPGVVI